MLAEKVRYINIGYCITRMCLTPARAPGRKKCCSKTLHDGKTNLYQGSVLSPLLFSVVMNVVSSEERIVQLSELPYADDLVLMAPII